jgi:leucyl-tRNA synthetase
MRGTVELPKDCDQATAEAMGLELDTVVKAINGKVVRKVIYVPNRILNVIV